jgi:hypothetical protein
VSPVSAACPNCGATVEFRFDDTFVRVCSYCNAVVARADRRFDSLGVLGDLAESQSPLALFAGGRHQGIGFQLVGRAQIAHAAGGGWEEWYARFDDGRWGWIAEAQGRFQLSFAVPDLVAVIPAQETLHPGAIVDHPAGRFTVAEVGEATYRAAAGEMPYRLVPGERFRFADLSGQGGQVATIDYGATGEHRPTLYLGREVALADLHIEPGSEPAPRPAVKVSGRHVACTQCRGSLELRAPDITQRVVCPYCSAVLDVSQGNLSYLKTLARGQMARPDIPLGSTADFAGGPYTVIGCLSRNAIVDGVPYPFTEYLLYRAETGYRWLVESSNHWSFVEPVPAGEVSGGDSSARHGGRRYRHFQTCSAEVAAIYGELYWKAEIGETVIMADFTSPPYLLSREESRNELQWARGTWISPKELAARIAAPAGEIMLAPPGGVAPNQPYRHKGMFRLTLIFALLLGAIGAVMAKRAPDRVVPVTWQSESPPLESNPSGNQTRVDFSDPFELDGDLNIRFAVETTVSNSWAYFIVDLVNEQTGLIETFDLGVEYWSGYDGESWSEGSRSGSVVLRPLPSGRYVMRLETQLPVAPAMPDIRVALSQGEFRARYFLIAAGALFFIPFFAFIGWFVFEKRRWSESDHAWSGG